MQVDTIYDIITIIISFHICHIRNGNIYVGLNIYCVALYEMHINLNQFVVILSISLHVILYLIHSCMMNDLRYNVQFNIIDSDRTSSYIELCNFQKRI